MHSSRRQEDAFFIVFGGGLFFFFIYATRAVSAVPDLTFIFQLVMAMFIPLVLANFAYSLGRGRSPTERFEDANWFQITYTVSIVVTVMYLGFRTLLFFERFYGSLDRTIIPFFYCSLILCGGILNQFKYRYFVFTGFVLGLMSGLGLYLIVDSFRKVT